LAGLDTPSDRSMILLQIIIQIGTGSTAAATTQLPLLLQFRHHLRIGGVAVNDGHARAGMSGILQGSLEKAPGAGASRVAESQKSMVAPMESITRVRCWVAPRRERNSQRHGELIAIIDSAAQPCDRSRAER